MFILLLLVWLFLAAPGSAAAPSFDLTVLHKGDNGIFAVGDMDGDGRRDIVSARKPEPLRWMSWPPREAHPIASSGNVWMEIQTGDADGDGDVDVLGPDMAANEIVWWENPGKAAAGGDWHRHRIGAWEVGFPHDFKTGDVDKDGRLDAVLRLKDSREFRLFLQREPLRWTEVRLPGAAGNGEGTALGDIDGDGDLDLCDGLVWLETPEDPVGGTWKTHAFNAGYGSTLTRVALADIDKDGRADIVVAPSDTSLALPVLWFGAADPSGPWKPHLVVPAGRAAWLHSLQVGDVDGDGHADILTGADHRGSRELILALGRDGGRGEAWEISAWKTAYGAWQALLADLDGDGALDILSADDANDSQQEAWIQRREGGTATGRVRIAPPVAPAEGYRAAVPVFIGPGGLKDPAGRRVRAP